MKTSKKQAATRLSQLANRIAKLFEKHGHYRNYYELRAIIEGHERDHRKGGRRRPRSCTIKVATDYFVVRTFSQWKTYDTGVISQGIRYMAGVREDYAKMAAMAAELDFYLGADPKFKDDHQEMRNLFVECAVAEVEIDYIDL